MKKIKPLIAWAVIGKEDRKIATVKGMIAQFANPYAVYDGTVHWNKDVLKSYKAKIIKVKITQI